MKAFLKATEIIDYHHPEVAAKAREIAKDCVSDEAIARNCFLFVRDAIRHSGDYKDDITTCTASEVLQHQTGWCYAKAHLLAALLRANGVPAGFSYQRLSCSEYTPGVYCLHGLNWIYIKKYGWYRVDPRGNKEGVDAQFTPPYEKLAFAIGEHEFDLHRNLPDPLPKVVEALRHNRSYAEMIKNFPDTINMRG